MTDTPIDLAEHRRQEILKAAGYSKGLPRYAVPEPATLPEIVLPAEVTSGETLVIMLAPPQGLADGWCFTPAQARLVAALLSAAADHVEQRP